MAKSRSFAKTDQISNQMRSSLKKAGGRFYAAIGASLIPVSFGIYCLSVQLIKGAIVTGTNNPVAWGIYRINFTFWMGVALFGLLISTILFFSRSQWKNSLSRIAIAMTAFAGGIGGVFLFVNIGRTELSFWLFSFFSLSINLRSPLIWDFFIVFAYLLVSIPVFILNIIPDIALLRDRSSGFRRKIYRVFALRWQGTPGQIRRSKKTYLILIAYAAPLVIFVHSITFRDFTGSVAPPWHGIIFVLHFIAGAVLSGTAIMMGVLYLFEKFTDTEKSVFEKHFSGLSRLMLLSSLVISFVYLVEFLISLISQNIYYEAFFHYRAFGFYGFIFWSMLVCNSILPLSIFFKKVRAKPKILLMLSIFIIIGVWLDRFVNTIAPLSYDYDPYTWGFYFPTYIEWGMVLGSFGAFLLFFLIFMKFSRIEVRKIKE